MAWGDVASGAGTGATIGSAFGPWGGLAGGLIGGAAGGLLGQQSGGETNIQKTQRELVDQLLGSLNGEGPYSDLFNPSDADFERSFANPARSRFQNITAPQIQQSYIANGQHRGTGLEDTLARAGVDMDSLLNENYLKYKQGGQDRRSGAIGKILGQGAGAQDDQSWGGAALQGLGGYLTSDSFGNDFENILSSFNKDPYNQDDSLMDTFLPPRKGFENENPIYNPYTGVQQ